MAVGKSTGIGFVLLLLVAGVAGIYISSRNDADEHAQTPSAVTRKSRSDGLKRLTHEEVQQACTKHDDWDIEICRAMDQKKVTIGMTAEQVFLAVGKPKTVNSMIAGGSQSDQWVYGDEQLTVENGIVTSKESLH